MIETPPPLQQSHMQVAGPIKHVVYTCTFYCSNIYFQIQNFPVENVRNIEVEFCDFFFIDLSDSCSTEMINLPINLERVSNMCWQWMAVGQGRGDVE